MKKTGQKNQIAYAGEKMDEDARVAGELVSTGSQLLLIPVIAICSSLNRCQSSLYVALKSTALNRSSQLYWTMSVLRPFLRDLLSVQMLTARVRQESHKVTAPIHKVCGRLSDVLLACRYGGVREPGITYVSERLETAKKETDQREGDARRSKGGIIASYALSDSTPKSL